MGDCFSFACLGCGVGLGAAITSLQQSRGSTRAGPALSSKDERQHYPPDEITESLDQQCAWLNSVVAIVWPRVDRYMKILVERMIQPAINQALPHAMKDSVKIQRLSLGEATPSLRNFKVVERTNKAIVLELSVDVVADVDVQIRAMHLPLGVRQLTFRGVMTVVLAPPSTEPPFFGGIQIYFVNPPELGFDFTGAAAVADFKVVKSVLQKTIRSQLKEIVVTPARIAVDLKPNAVDAVSLKFPEPIGALRVLVKSAADLRGDDMSFRGERTSDPYVTVEVGQALWQTARVTKNCNPVWEHGNVQDFLVYDSKQIIRFEVYDWDRFGGDDFLGSAKDIPIEHFALSGQVMDEKLDILDSHGGPAGSLVVSTRWFTFTDKVPVKGIAPAVARGPHQLFLEVKVEDVHELPADSVPPFTVNVRVGREYTAKTAPSRPPPQSKGPRDLTKVILKLHERHMPVEEIAQVTGLLATQVATLISQQMEPAARQPHAEKASRKREAAEHPTFREVVRLLLPWTEDIINEQVTLELHDKEGRLVGSRVEFLLADAVSKELHGPFSILPGAAIRGSLSTRWFCLP